MTYRAVRRESHHGAEPCHFQAVRQTGRAGECLSEETGDSSQRGMSPPVYTNKTCLYIAATTLYSN